MKLFWKMFFSLIIIVTVIFSIFGGIFIKLSFDNSLSRELSRKQNENQMFVYSFELQPQCCHRTEYIQKNDIEKIIVQSKEVWQKPDRNYNCKSERKSNIY